MIGAPCQSSSLLTRTRTLSSRQIRQRGSLRSKSALRGSAALVIVLIGNSSIRATSPSDTDMAFPPRSRRTGAVVDGFILPQTRPVARQGTNDKHRSMPRQIRSKMRSKSGVSAVLTCIWNTALPQMERSELCAGSGVIAGVEHDLAAVVVARVGG